MRFAQQELFHSNTAFFYYSLVSAGVRLLILNHLLACCWWGVALMSPDQNWARQEKGRKNTTYLVAHQDRQSGHLFGGFSYVFIAFGVCLERMGLSGFWLWTFWDAAQRCHG